MQLNKTNTPIAVDKRTKIALPQDIVSTQQFMLLQPVFYRRLLKTERYVGQSMVKILPQAMVCPTFGRARFNLRTFFVPYFLVFPNWYRFAEQSVAHNASANAIPSNPPYFTANDLMTLFTSASYGLTSVVTSNGNFTINNTIYQFTQLGRYFYKVLYNLGYDLVGKTSGDSVFVFNALNLLAYAKIYCDWYANSQYLNSADYLRLERYFKFNTPNSALHLTDSDLYYILLFIRPSIYESNGYFEAAWDNPTAPTSGNYSNLSFLDINGTFGRARLVADSTTDGTVVMKTGAASDTALGTQFMHDALKKMTDAYRRHAIAGARAIDRVLLSYGVMPPSLRIERSVYVGQKSVDIDVQSIFASSNGSVTFGSETFKSVTGDRAGAALGQGKFDFDFTAEEDGVYMTISTIQPSAGYFQGYDRINRHFTRDEFFVPEYDSLSVQSIQKGEVYISKDFDTFSNDANNYSGHFGFTSRYGELKRSINRISGDIVNPVINSGGDAWHLNRVLTDAYFGNSVNNIVHSEDFARGSDALQYDRLFYYIGDDKNHLDPFYIFVHNEAASYAPMSSLFESYEFDSNGKEINVDVNGPKLN